MARNLSADLSISLSPTLSREGHHHTIKAPIAGEGVDRSEIEKFVLNLR
ncbi:hypothetical protein NKV53_01075 [Legionella sp. 27cVA30]|nr:hypothetical protein [Legionella sp. 27cVA30]MCP0912967.1 hypothetical protein [Legionella sp. 27cVA30]